MSDRSVDAIEYEAMLLGRHLTGLAGGTRRTGGILDQSAYLLLSLLQAGGAASIGELSAITGLDASTLNRQTAALLRAGHAERIPDPDGGIARKFRATRLGSAALTEEREASHAALESIIERWGADDRSTLARLLNQLNLDIEARVGRRWPRP